MLMQLLGTLNEDKCVQPLNMDAEIDPKPIESPINETCSMPLFMKLPDPTEITFDGIERYVSDDKPLKHVTPRVICDVVLNVITVIELQLKNAFSEMVNGTVDENDNDVIFVLPLNAFFSIVAKFC